MYCQNCGAKITNPKAKFCPSCGSPIVYKKTSPIVDAIILGGIIVLFVFTVIQISKLITAYKIKSISEPNYSIPATTSQTGQNRMKPDIRPPGIGTGYIGTISNPSLVLIERIKRNLAGAKSEVSVNYNRELGGYEVKVKTYKNPSFAENDYIDMFARVFALCYGETKLNVKFVVCNVLENNTILLSIAIGAEAASRIPQYTWDMFGRNGNAFIRWIEKNKTSAHVGKLAMCRYLNNF